jgi:O6-methylguanine-DNA--protein-cysteine methyltransferase
MWAATSDKGLVQFHISGNKESFLRELKTRIRAEHVEDPNKFKELKSQLDRYFKGERLIFEVPFDMRGTPFQVAVWKAIYSIPYGKLTSYGGIAKHIGHPKAVRAVGTPSVIIDGLVVLSQACLLGGIGALRWQSGREVTRTGGDPRLLSGHA